MAECNSTVSNNVTIAVLEITAAIGNTFTILVLSRTPNLKGPAGAILINDQVSTLLNQIIGVVYILSFLKLSHTARTGFLATLFLSRYVSLVLMTLSNINLYVALCKATKYKVLVTNKRAAIAISSAWVVAIVTAVLPFVHDDFYDIECEFGLPLEKMTWSTAWIAFFRVLLYVVIPFTVNTFCLVKIVRESSTLPSNLNLNTSNARNKKLKLVRLMVVTTLLDSCLVMTSLIFITFDSLLAVTTVGRKVTMAMVISVRIYRNLRPIVLFICYHPMVETVKTMMSACKRTNKVTSLRDDKPQAWTSQL